MDEFGSRIQHSDEPTLMMKLFYYVPMKLSFSVIWPLRDLQCGGKYNVAQFIIRQASPLCQLVQSNPHCLLPVSYWISVFSVVFSYYCKVLVVNPVCMLFW